MEHDRHHQRVGHERAHCRAHYPSPHRAGADRDGAVDLTIEAACRMLRLPTIRDTCATAAEAALKGGSTYKQFLAELLTTESEERDERSRQRRVRDANFSRTKRIENFDFGANPYITPEVINGLTDPGWVTAGKPLVLVGDWPRETAVDRHKDRRAVCWVKGEPTYGYDKYGSMSLHVTRSGYLHSFDTAVSVDQC